MKDHKQKDVKNDIYLCITHKCRCGAHKVGRCEKISQITGDVKKKRFAETGYEGVKSA